MQRSLSGNSFWRPGAVSSPLTLAASVFDRVAAQELPTGPRPVPHPQDRPVESWGELRLLLREPGLATEVVDAIWAWLIERSREQGGDATLVCVSLAMPMLAGTAGQFASPASAHRHDIESEILTGFLDHLACVALDPPGVWHRLRWAVYRAAVRAIRQHDTHPVPVADNSDLDRDLDLAGANGRMMAAEPGHPETVLAQAVASGVITADAAELIVLTRWEGQPLNRLAAETGVSHWTLRKRRQRAEAALAPWLAERTRDHTDLSTTEAIVLNGLPSRHQDTAAPRRPAPLSPLRSHSDQEARPCA